MKAEALIKKLKKYIREGSIDTATGRKILNQIEILYRGVK